MAKRPAEGAAEGERDVKRVRGLPELIERVREDTTLTDLPDELMANELLLYIDRPKELADVAQINKGMARVLSSDAIYIPVMKALFWRHYRSPLTRRPYAVCAVVIGAVNAIPGLSERRKVELAYSLMSQVLRATYENLFTQKNRRGARPSSVLESTENHESGVGVNAVFMCRAISFEPLAYAGTVDSEMNVFEFWRLDDGILEIRIVESLETVPKRISTFIEYGPYGDLRGVYGRASVESVSYVYHDTLVGTGYRLRLGVGSMTHCFVSQFDPEPVWRANPHGDKWQRRMDHSDKEQWDVGAFVALAYGALAQPAAARVIYRDLAGM
jgi:hypothetical protein